MSYTSAKLGGFEACADPADKPIHRELLIEFSRKLRALVEEANGARYRPIGLSGWVNLDPFDAVLEPAELRRQAIHEAAELVLATTEDSSLADKVRALAP